MTTSALDVTRSDCERVFRRNGLPLLIEGHSAGRDVFGRAAPFLLFVLIAQLASAADLSWPWYGNAAAIVGALVVVVGGYMVLNRLRGRPATTLPQRVDATELVFFVLAPALLPMLFGGQELAAAVIATANLVLLGLVWVTVTYGLGSTLWWGLARIVDELAASLARLLRLLPLLLVFSLVLFFNEPVWQVFDTIAPVGSFVLASIFVLLILVSLYLRLPSEVDAVLAASTERVPGAHDLPALTRSQRFNVNTMMLASQLLQVIVVSAGVGIFFMIAGVFALSPELHQTWDIGGGTWSVELNLAGTPLLITHTLVRVSVAIATFTGLYYAIAMLTDAIYRTEFIEAMTAQMAQVSATRLQYRQFFAAPEDAPCDSRPLNG